MTQDANINKMERGREAAAIDALVKPYVQIRIDNITDQLVGFYRGGIMSHDIMVGKIGEITALLDMLSSLETMQRQGDAAAQQEMGNAEDPNRT
jgi:hypothetical protein